MISSSIVTRNAGCADDQPFLPTYPLVSVPRA
jgi:hypothetical protein